MSEPKMQLNPEPLQPVPYPYCTRCHRTSRACRCLDPIFVYPDEPDYPGADS